MPASGSSRANTPSTLLMNRAVPVVEMKKLQVFGAGQSRLRRAV